MATTPNIEPKSNGFFNGATELAQYLVSQGKNDAKNELAVNQKLIEIDGVQHYWGSSNLRWRPITAPIPDDEPVPERYVFFTLDGLIDYIRENAEGNIPQLDSEAKGGDRLILQVVNHHIVRLMSQPSKYKKARHCIACVEAHVPDIRFDSYMDIEQFNVQLLSTFIETPVRAELFKIVKSLTKEQNCNVTDDGVSQVLTVKQGVSLAQNVTLQNPVPLKPMRTFSEVDQPESNFTLRVNGDADVALFEADGGAWKNAAVANIKNYLESKLYGYGVVVLA